MPCVYDDVPGSWGRQSEGWPEVHDPDNALRMLIISGKVKVPYGSYVTVGDKLRLETQAYVAEVLAASSPQPAPQPTEAEGREDVWGRFASWLLYHCEGMIISEEMLQQQLDVMLATSSKQDPAEAEELRSCAICGLTVDLSNGHTKPTIDFGMAGRSKPKAPPPEQPAIDLEQFRPAVEALERAGRQSEVKDGVLHWTLNAKHWRAQELFALIDGAKAGRAKGEGHG